MSGPRAPRPAGSPPLDGERGGPLWEAVGRPAWEAPLPSSRSPAWLRAVRSLRGRLDRCPRLRSWRSLWARVRSDPVPPRGTWGQLCAGADLSRLVDPCPGGRLFGFTSWNLRWMVDPHAESVCAKRALVLRACLRGEVCALQETHWDQHAAGVWEASFPGCRVVSSASADGPAGGRTAAGVALVLPPGHSVVDVQELAPGQVLFVRATSAAGEAYCAASVYARPEDRDVGIEALLALRVDAEVPMYVAGDLNVQLGAPRTEVEARYAADIGRWAQAQGLACLSLGGPTCVKGTGPEGRASEIDFLFVPAAAAACTRVLAAWHHHLSDHALLSVREQAPHGAGGRACTSAAMRSLPPGAAVDLRLRLTGLSAVFGIRAPDEAAGDDGDAGDIEWNPGLAAGGAIFLRHTVQAWWGRWRRRAPGGSGVLAALLAAAAGRAPVAPAGELREWLDEQGIEDDEIEPAQAARLVAVFRAQGAACRRVRLGAHVRGPGVRRPAIPERYRLGKALYHRRTHLVGLRGPGGELIQDPAAIDEALWRSRAGIWQSPPAMGPAASALLDRRGRAAVRVPAAPKVRRRDAMKAVLASSGAAPGADGIPYEALHFGASFVAELAGQAVLASVCGAGAVREVLGGDPDLLVWIPKLEGIGGTDDQRPLNLPTTLKRVYGATLLAGTGEGLEECLSESQAARRHGDCAPNVRRVYDHLGGGDRPWRPVIADADLWNAVLGPAAGAAARLCDRVDRGAPAPIRWAPAALLLDQSKAFERIGHWWLRAALGARGIPSWLVEALMATAEGRTVVTVLDACGAPRGVATGLGMGHPVSPLLWGLGYDPLVFCLTVAIGVVTPTYVDDLAGCCYGPGQVLAAVLFLFAACTAAGLHVDTHTCHGALDGPGAADALRHLGPLGRVTGGSDRDGWRPCLPPALLEALWHEQVPASLAPAVCGPGADEGGRGPRWCSWRQAAACCRCKLKTKVVPRDSVPTWADALGVFPTGSGSVTVSGPLLGVQVHAMAEGAAAGRSWEDDALAAAAALTWAKPLRKITARAGACAAARPAPGVRAHHWNVYMVSCVPHPARAFDMPAHVAREALAAMSKAMGAPRWIPARFLPGLGVVLGARAAPKCPVAYSRAVALRHWARGRSCGPDGGHRQAQTDWQELRRFAGDLCSGAAGHGFAAALARLRLAWPAADRKILAGLVDGGLGGQGWEGAAVGGALYRALWAQAHGMSFLKWLEGRSKTRRWWGTGGSEWAAIPLTRDFNEAWHLLKTLSGGSKGKAGLRPRQDRDLAPRRCADCAGGDVALAATTPAPASGHQGLAWCRRCFPAAGAPGAVAQALCRLDPAGHWPVGAAGSCPAAARAAARVAEVGATAGDPCAMCGLGEDSSEHLLGVCPAVWGAWCLLWAGRPPGAAGSVDDPVPLVAHLLDGGLRGSLARALVHQASFRASALRGRPPAAWQVSARRLARAVRARASLHAVGDDLGCPEEDAEPDPGLDGPASVWGWGTCGCAGPGPCRGALVPSGRAHAAARAAAGGVSARLLPVVRDRAAPGTVLASLSGEDPVGLWPWDGDGWFPCPRAAPEHASAEWTVA